MTKYKFLFIINLVNKTNLQLTKKIKQKIAVFLNGKYKLAPIRAICRLICRLIGAGLKPFSQLNYSQ